MELGKGAINVGDLPLESEVDFIASLSEGGGPKGRREGLKCDRLPNAALVIGLLSLARFTDALPLSYQTARPDRGNGS